MAIYNISRSIEASIMQFIEDSLITGDWTGVTVIKTFAKIPQTDLPLICIRVENTIYNRAEIGGNSIVRSPLVLIDLFCSNDGQRLDLKDFLISELKEGIPYYKYTINKGQITNKLLSGRITVISMEDAVINLNIDKNLLDAKDRYRTLISLTISLGQVE